MGYRNSVFIKRNNNLMEIPCDKKIYLDNDFYFSDEKHQTYTLYIEQEKLILETLDKQYTISSKVFQKLSKTSDIELFHFINKTKEIRTRNKECLIISNKDGDIIVPGAEDFRIEIFKDRTTYIEGIIYLNGKLADIKYLFEFAEDVQLFSGGLKFYFINNNLIVEGNRELYTTNLICVTPKKSELESFPDYERSPRIVKTVPEDKINFKNPPSKHERRKGELLRIIMPPLAMVGVTAATSIFLKRGIFVIVSIASMSVTMVVSIINYIGRQKELKEENRLRNKVYSEYLLKLRKKLNSLKEKQQEALLYQNPSYDEIYEMTQNYKDRIYERMNTEEDFLEVCIGTAETEASYEMKLPSESIEIKKDPLTEELRDIYKYFKKAGRLPFSVNLKKGHLGIIGDREIIHEQLELIILQLAFMHSYHNLEFIFVYNRKYRKKFDYLKWLPHFKISALGLRGMVDCERDRELVLGSFSKILKDRETRMKEKD